ncbi:MAG: hypothetical protein KGM24_00920, partial [Elusimicrobia bacterium]|nr:hypothetical protein [Elusimicrobiota bacterium]
MTDHAQGGAVTPGTRDAKGYGRRKPRLSPVLLGALVALAPELVCAPAAAQVFESARAASEASAAAAAPAAASALAPRPLETVSAALSPSPAAPALDDA